MSTVRDFSIVVLTLLIITLLIILSKTGINVCVGDRCANVSMGDFANQKIKQVKP